MSLIPSATLMQRDRPGTPPRSSGFSRVSPAPHSPHRRAPGVWGSVWGVNYAGRVVRDERGRRRQPLGLASIRKVLQVLGVILDDAVEDELLESNPWPATRKPAVGVCGP
jgi:hypothetical protein